MSEHAPDANADSNPPAPVTPPRGGDSPAAAPAATAATGLPALALASGLLALLAAAGALTGGYFIWHEVQRQGDWQAEVVAQIDHRNQAMAQRLEAMQHRLDQALAEVEAGKREQQQALDRLAREQQALAAAFDHLRTRLGRRLEGWILAEAQYLLEIANQRLRLFHDLGTARAALEEADRRLQEADDPGLVPVREEIARELAALDAVNLPDLPGLSMKLAALAGQVAAWPLAGRETIPPAGPAGSSEASREPAPGGGWRAALARLWTALRELVRVRRTDRPVTPMLAPREEFFLRTNLQLQLDAARLALLREEPTLYRESLKRAAAWLERHFDARDPGVQAARRTIDALARIDPAPRLPDLSGSLRLLRDRLQALEATGEHSEKARP